MQFWNVWRPLYHLWFSWCVSSLLVISSILERLLKIRGVNIYGFRCVGISDAYYCAECTRLEKDRDGCPKIVNLGASRTDLFYERRRLGTFILFLCGDV